MAVLSIFCEDCFMDVVDFDLGVADSIFVLGLRLDETVGEITVPVDGLNENEAKGFICLRFSSSIFILPLPKKEVKFPELLPFGSRKSLRWTFLPCVS